MEGVAELVLLGVVGAVTATAGVAKINKGRVFYTTPDKLGQYILVDYVQNKRKQIRG